MEEDLEYDPKDAEAMGVAAFGMMIGLLGVLRDKHGLNTEDGRAIMMRVLHQPPMPGTNPPYQLTEKVRARLEEENLAWVRTRRP